MNGPNPYDWIFLAAGWTVAGLAMLLLTWSLFGDRARGRRRCPKCWYDMAGVRGLHCPECGRIAKRERSLSRTRRRWRWVCLAALVGTVGYATTKVPTYRERGWTGVIPSTLLIAIAPPDVPEVWLVAMGSGRTPFTPTGIAESLTAEVWSRMSERSMWPWQVRHYMKRWIAAKPAHMPLNSDSLPSRWPVDHDLWLSCLESPSPLVRYLVCVPGGPLHVAEPFAALRHGGQPTEIHAVEVRIFAEGTEVYACEIPVHTRLEGTVATFLDPLDSVDLNTRVLELLKPRVVFADGTIVLEYSTSGGSDRWKALDLVVHFDAELVQEGRTFGSCIGAATPPSEDRGAGDRRIRRRLVGALDTFPDFSRPMKLVLTGSPAVAGAAYCDNPAPATRPAAWAGKITVPIDQIRLADPN